MQLKKSFFYILIVVFIAMIFYWQYIPKTSPYNKPSSETIAIDTLSLRDLKKAKEAGYDYVELTYYIPFNQYGEITDAVNSSIFAIMNTVKLAHLYNLKVHLIISPISIGDKKIINADAVEISLNSLALEILKISELSENNKVDKFTPINIKAIKNVTQQNININWQQELMKDIEVEYKGIIQI